ncbi:MAG: SRPBCC family protein [Methylocella sp.]
MRITLISDSAFAGIALAATPALALYVSRSAEIAAPPAKVWAAIGGFCGISDWHPAIEKCILSNKDGKMIRTLSLKGGGSIIEEQVSRSDDRLNYTYTILESPLPVEDYKSTISVRPAGVGSKVIWVGEFKAKGAEEAKAQATVAGIFEAGLKGIADKVK